MREREFAVTWDYRGRFPRNLCEHVLVGLAAGAPWKVRFWPFSIDQVQREAGQPDVWDDPSGVVSFLAMQVGIAVRDGWPDRFPALHVALFAARHDHGRDIADPDVLGDVLQSQGLDPAAVLATVAGRGPLDTYRAEHQRAVTEHGAFGIPTVIVGPEAVFVRLMSRPDGDADLACRTVDRLLELAADVPDLNEFKRTEVPGGHTGAGPEHRGGKGPQSSQSPA